MGNPDKKKPRIKKEESSEDEDEDDLKDSDEENDDNDEADDRDHSKKQSKNAATKRNTQGEAYFELARTRRVTVRSFKGAKLIDIREFYEKNGNLEPGKKGISLSSEQYKALKEIVKAGYIDDELSKMG